MGTLTAATLSANAINAGVTSLSNTNIYGTANVTGTLTTGGGASVPSLIVGGTATITGLSTLSDTSIYGQAGVTGTLTAATLSANAINAGVTSGQAGVTGTLTAATLSANAINAGVTSLSNTNIYGDFTATGAISLSAAASAAIPGNPAANLTIPNTLSIENISWNAITINGRAYYWIYDTTA
ncbi:MAG: hypothetical protein US03_C0016G0014 [candidate division TM6 bacterium GW2011_GWF2_36_131]|nr:MAG: hypothetical protein US03_C0016G0014 [candidate division TM6 bacterium GW2011_GWF2_36_131]